MNEQLAIFVNEFARQFPVVLLTLLLSWYFLRYVTRQHERELKSKNEEIQRILEEKNRELDRLLEERRKYFQLFLKEVRAASVKQSPETDDDEPRKPSR